MQVTFIIKTQQLSLKKQQDIRHNLSVSRVNSASVLPACMCVGEEKLTVQMVAHGYRQLQGQPAPRCISVPLWLSLVLCELPLSQITGWGKEQHQECCFSFPLEADLSSKWALSESAMWLCWWRGGFAQRNPIFSKPKREREKPHGHHDVPLTPL